VPHLDALHTAGRLDMLVDMERAACSRTMASAKLL
jgi:hypothetical protein